MISRVFSSGAPEPKEILSAASCSSFPRRSASFCFAAHGFSATTGAGGAEGTGWTVWTTRSGRGGSGLGRNFSNAWGARSSRNRLAPPRLFARAGDDAHEELYHAIGMSVDELLLRDAEEEPPTLHTGRLEMRPDEVVGQIGPFRLIRQAVN